MPITFDPGCANPGDRTEYLYRLREKLRLEHNVNGQKFLDGKITQAQWDDYYMNTFNPKNNMLSDAILAEREKMKGRDLGSYAPRWDPDLTVIGATRITP